MVGNRQDSLRIGGQEACGIIMLYDNKEMAFLMSHGWDLGFGGEAFCD